MGCPKSFSRERGGSNTSSYLANCLRMLVHSSEECLRGHEDVEELRRFSNHYDIFGRFSERFHQSEIWLSVFSSSIKNTKRLLSCSVNFIMFSQYYFQHLDADG